MEVFCAAAHAVGDRSFVFVSDLFVFAFWSSMVGVEVTAMSPAVVVVVKSADTAGWVGDAGACGRDNGGV